MKICPIVQQNYLLRQLIKSPDLTNFLKFHGMIVVWVVNGILVLFFSNTIYLLCINS